MTTPNLLNSKRLSEISDLCEEISDACTNIQDDLSEYENVEEYPAAERAEARQDLRDNIWARLGDLLSDAEKLRVIRDRIEEAMAKP